jgi:D-erythronate 2-dehydrogenase
MHILVLGAAGMLVRKLAARLVSQATLGGQPISEFTLADIVAADAPAGFTGKVNTLATDVSAPETAKTLIDARPDVIFHLASIVSGEAEADFEKGYRVNFDGSRHLFEAIRHAHLADGYFPRLIFTSSVAVFGIPFPPKIPDEFFQTPLSSYGTQKAMVELMLADYTRRGFFDGIGIRLPTICIRPGKPNMAASGFFSNILREPLVGQPAVLPVPDTVRHWFASPRAAIGLMMHAAELDLQRVGPRRNLNMPGLSATIAEEIEALRRVAGQKAVDLIRREPDAAIQAIISTWAEDFDTTRATSLGFKAEASFDEIIQVHIEDELGGIAPHKS